MLASLGIASAQAALLACAPRAARPARRPTEVDPEIGTWLRDAVSRLRGAGFASVHVLAVSRQRTTAAIDVLGAGVARGRSDGVVITVRDASGLVREQVTNELTRDGIATAVKLLAPTARAASVDFGRGPSPAAAPLSADPALMSDAQILARVGALASRDRELSSRIVYSAVLLDIDDALVWSVAPGRDVHQRLVRVRRSISRVAWNGTRPVVGEAARAWTGGIDDQDLEDDELAAAREAALAMMTPSAFDDREYTFALAPHVTATLIDAAVHALFTTTAVRRPDVAARLARLGTRIGSPLVTLVDDPTAPAAYGGFAFDDDGTPAKPLLLVDRGQLAAHLDRACRPGHVGLAEPLASHLRLAPGTLDQAALLDEGFALEGPLGATVDPASDRVVIAAARARERAGGKRTGRQYADIELVGTLSELLTSITAVSTQTATIGIRDERDNQPRFRSLEMPWLRGRGLLRARRRPST